MHIEKLLRANECEVRFDDADGQEKRLIMLLLDYVDSITGDLIVGMVFERIGRWAKRYLFRVVLLIAVFRSLFQNRTIALVVVIPICRELL